MNNNTIGERSSGSSPGPDMSLALRRVLNLFHSGFPYTSIRVEHPDDYRPLPSQFTLRRLAGVSWLCFHGARPSDGGGKS